MLSKLLRWFFQIVVVVVLVLLALAAVGLVCYGVYYTYRHNPPRIENLDQRLPLIFHFDRLWVLWLWLIGLLAGALGVGFWLLRLVRGQRASRSVPETLGLIGRTPELDEAWKEIEIRSGRGFVDRVYLLLTPSEEHADALLDASGLHVESRFPRVPSFLHAALTSGATFFTCVARPPQVDPESGQYGIERGICLRATQGRELWPHGSPGRRRDPAHGLARPSRCPPAGDCLPR